VKVLSPTDPDALISDLALATIRDGVAMVQGDGEIVAVNRIFCEMTGFQSHELIGARPPYVFWPEEELGRIVEAFAVATRDGGGESDLTFARKSGERFPVIASVGLATDGNVRIVVVKDITERVALLAALADAKREAETARLAFTRSAEVIGECLYSSELLPDQRFVLYALGPGFGRLVGAEQDPVDLMADLNECLHDDDREGWDRTWNYATLREANGQILEQRYRLVGHDGVTRWVLDRARITVSGRRVFLDGAACDVSALQAAEAERAVAVGRLEWLSRVDSLTGLFNRRHFSELLRTRWATADSGLALALVDIDSFKDVNDTYGHSAGDAVLREVSFRLKRSTRSSDLIARWGGEEFCVLLGGVRDDLDMYERAEQLRLAVTERVVRIPGLPPIAVTVSVGIARAEGREPIDAQLAQADIALYEAKHAGRNLTRVATSDRRTRMRR
jgi:diguanylate cyclase (GGDEF)-like protein/PAS domain S-box-containing protein